MSRTLPSSGERNRTSTATRRADHHSSRSCSTDRLVDQLPCDCRFDCHMVEPSIETRRGNSTTCSRPKKNGESSAFCKHYLPIGPLYCSELPTAEKALLAFEPTSRSVPMTITSMAASITAYSIS